MPEPARHALHSRPAKTCKAYCHCSAFRLILRGALVDMDSNLGVFYKRDALGQQEGHQGLNLGQGSAKASSSPSS